MDPADATPQRPPVRLPVDRWSEMSHLGLSAFWVLLMLHQANAHGSPLESGRGVLFGVGAAGFALNGASYLWRVLVPRPAIEATEAGLLCHPSYHFGTLPWAEIRKIEVVGSLPGALRIHMRRRFWSMTNWLSGTRINLSLRAHDLTREQGGKLADELDAWRKAAASPEVSGV